MNAMTILFSTRLPETPSKSKALKNKIQLVVMVGKFRKKEKRKVLK